MTIFVRSDLEPRIERLARRRLNNLMFYCPGPVLPHPDDLIRICRPWAMAKMARRLWARGHDIEGYPCPRAAYRLTSGPLVS